MQATAAGRLAFSYSYALSSSSSSAAASFGSRRRVIIGIPGALHRVNIKKRGKSFTASVCPNLPKPSKGNKTRSEGRRALVESFVDKYRTENAGRFPTASFVKQEVGGSYYTVRQIVQELEYKQKFSPLKSIDAAESGEVAEVSIQHSKEANYMLKKLEKVSGTEEEISLSTHDPDNKVDEKVTSACDGNEILGKTTNQSFKAIEDCSSSEADQKIDVCDQSLKANIESSSSNVNTEVQKEDDQSFGSKPDLDIKNKDTHEFRGDKEEGNKVADKEEKQSELPGRSDHEEPSPKASSLWKNLISFTDGIVSFWKKL